MRRLCVRVCTCGGGVFECGGVWVVCAWMFCFLCLSFFLFSVEAGCYVCAGVEYVYVCVCVCCVCVGVESVYVCVCVCCVCVRVEYVYMCVCVRK